MPLSVCVLCVSPLFSFLFSPLLSPQVIHSSQSYTKAGKWTSSVHSKNLGVAVFACGPAALVADVEEQTIFHKAEFHKEVFAL